jgi:hypothetical protein
MTIVYKEGKIYIVTIANIPYYICPNVTRISSLAVGKRGQWVLCKQLYYVFGYFCKVDYMTYSFIHTPTFSYNEVMHLLELVDVVEHA